MVENSNEGITPVVVTLDKMSTADHPLSRQKKTDTIGLPTGVQKHPIRFSLLVEAYESNFIVGGALDKIATACSTNFVAWNDPEEMDEKEKDLRRLLNDISIDIEYYFLSLLVTGNAFAEVMVALDGTPYITRFLTSEMYVKLKRVTEADVEDGVEVPENGLMLQYVQSVTGKEVEFTKEEVIHRKTVSLSNRYYGASKFAKASKQILLLEAIDDYYVRLFDKGLINPSLLIDKSRKLTEKQKEAIKNIVNDSLRGKDNAYKTAIIPGEIEKLDLNSDEDTKSFLEYRDRLIRNIATAINVPYDLLDSINSNRSTSEVAREQLNRDIVLPLQLLYVNVLKKELRPYYENLVDNIELKAPDTKNQLEEMKVDTGYRKAGVLTANEVRNRLGYEEIEGGDVLETSTGNDPVVAEIEKELEKVYAPEVLAKIQARNV